MEAKQQIEKAELERLQQEVESQRKESEEVHQRIMRQEETLRHRSQDIESRLRDFLAEKERFEEERRSEIQDQKEQQEGEAEEEQDEELRRQQEAAEQTEIYRELEKLKREREEQKVRLETERRRLEEQEREQLSLVGRLEEQLREKHEAATTLLTREDGRRLEEERRALAEIREALLRAKEAGERTDVEGASEEAKSAQTRYTDFKAAQVKELGQLEEELQQQKERLEEEVAAERATMLFLGHGLKEHQQQLKETQEKGAQDATVVCQEEQLVKQAEHRLQFKERQLASLADSLLPALAEEKQRAAEILERSGKGDNGNCESPPGLDNTLYQVEKELEDKEEKLNLHWNSAQQLQQLQETYEFTANVARQEEKVRRKEKEILESKEKQQREAMEQAVARLERRHSALRRSVSLEPDTEEQRHKSSVLRNQRTGVNWTSRVEREIQKLRQRISEGEENSRTHSNSNDDKTGHSSPVSHIQSLNTLLPLSDDRINAYIEEEVQRRLRKLNLLNGSSNKDLSLSCESLRDDEKLQNINPRRFKYEEKVQHETSDPGIVVEAETPCDQMTKTSARSHINFKLKSKESVNGQPKQETGADKVEVNRSNVFGYFAGKLSEAYKDAGRRLQGTRDIIQNVGVGEMKVVLSQYVTMISSELPLINRMQLRPEPEPCVPPENKVSLVNLARDCTLSLPPNCDMSAIPGASRLPEGSVSSVKHTSHEVFHQRLVQLPSALSQLQSFSSQKMLEKLESLAPQIQVGKLLSIFWLKTANIKQPVPTPGCLLLSEKGITVVLACTDSEDSLAVFHHFNLLEIKKVQISLAGQHVRIIGDTEDTVLAVFTHSKELTQELCKALLKALAPEKLSEGHPLLTDDLMVLSLDWKARVPDIIMDNGLHITSRFKRVLADLLYIIHGNMDGPNKPSLAGICPLLYTSVKIKNSTRVHQDTIFQFLLTDTHVALLREDAVFHPVPQGSSRVPIQPQFQGLELRNRSDIQCLLLRQSDNCLVVEIVFTTLKLQTREGKVESRPAPPSSDHSNHCDSWKLCFGCTSEAVILTHHLCN
ncbi:kinesin-like protein KIF16B isoform X3 [Scomber scombrus]|uniref:Kinesin-like protein KIF16B isoform X3 n=1 Tax=Scomber scombrus TaxID=13677 RepID=A0AAV1QJ31_SCOSC